MGLTFNFVERAKMEGGVGIRIRIQSLALAPFQHFPDRYRLASCLFFFFGKEVRLGCQIY
jgi:hypothetical protein